MRSRLDRGGRAAPRARWAALGSWLLCGVGLGSASCEAAPADGAVATKSRGGEGGEAGGSSDEPTSGTGGVGASVEGGEGGSAGLDAADSDAMLRDDHATTARGFAVVVPVLRNDVGASADARIALVARPSHGMAQVRADGTIHYTPAEGFSGDDALSYKLDESASAVATVSIEVLDREWLLVGSTPFEVWRGPPPDGHREPNEQRWTFFDASGTEVFGYLQSEFSNRAFALPRGSHEPRFFAEAPSKAHHVGSHGVVSGAAAEGAALWLGGERVGLEPVLGALTELFAVNAAGAAVGRVTQGGRSVSVIYLAEAGLQPLPVPAGFDDVAAYGLSDDGAICGSATKNGVEVAMLFSGREVTPVELFEGAARSRAYDLNDTGVVVGSFHARGEHERGFLSPPGGPAGVVHVRGAVSTRLLGVDEQGALVGSFVDPLGYQSGFVAASNAARLAPGTSLLEAADAPNAGVAHACVHSMEGPFRVLDGGGSSEDADAFDEPHTSYTLLLDEEGVGRFPYRAPRAERISFFVSPAAVMRLYGPDGALELPALVRSSSSCAKIDFLFQFELARAGDYVLYVEASPSSTVYAIFERSWAYLP